MTETPTPMNAVELPRWDLTDLYPAPDSPELARDLETLDNEAKDFAKRYRGTLKNLAGSSFAAAIAEYERLVETMNRVMSYAQLLHAVNVTDPGVGRFYQSMQERITAISSETLFFTLEINRLDDDVLKRKLNDPEAARYAPWIRDLRAFKDHQLDDSLERLLHEKEVTGRAAWTRLFDETMAALRFPVEGKELTLTEAMDRLSDSDRTRRRTAAHAIARGLEANAPLLARITNTLVKDKEIEDTWRRYPSPITPRNLANQVEAHVVEALVTAVRDSYPRLAHRYYAMKARWLGLEKLQYWDRNAPLPGDDERRFSWDQARETVLSAYAVFSPDLAEVGRKFFDNPWIDAPPASGKSSGAFAHPTVPSAHPYLMLNFMGKTRDVMTLAHELGHGVHQVLSAGQGPLMSETPLTLAETASVFGEMLTFRALLDSAPDERTKRIMLASKVEDMLNTVVRQIAFHEFETRVHAERKEGELSLERLGEVWMETQGESLGPAVDLDREYRIYWAYIPHFVHVPFYVYAYAFGDCLVNSLYDVFREGDPGFAEKYLDLLRAGGTLRHKELLAPFGLDAGDPDFWKRGLRVVEGFISTLEEMDPERAAPAETA